MNNLSILKKSISTFAVMLIILLSTAAANAQYVNPETDPKPDSAQMHQKMLKHDPDLKYEEEIPATELPPAVSSAVEEAYAGHDISKVYQAYDGSFKIELEKGDDKEVKYYSINGELLGNEDYQDKAKEECHENDKP